MSEDGKLKLCSWYGTTLVLCPKNCNHVVQSCSDLIAICDKWIRIYKASKAWEANYSWKCYEIFSIEDLFHLCLNLGQSCCCQKSVLEYCCEDILSALVLRVLRIIGITGKVLSNRPNWKKLLEDGSCSKSHKVAQEVYIGHLTRC